MNTTINPSNPCSSNDPDLMWTEELSLGISIIDNDHKVIFELAQLIQNLLDAPSKHVMTESALAILEDNVFCHFIREENAMNKVMYPNKSVHIYNHKQFYARLHSIVQSYNGGSKMAIFDLPHLVVGWFAKHIAAEDSKYKKWIKENDLDGRPLGFLTEEATR